MTTYLAGPIAGCTDEQANSWRDEARQLLRTGTLDPMARDYRGREYENVSKIVELDKADILACDAVLAYLPFPSYGTAMEILFAYERSIPVIAVAASGVSPWVIYHAHAVVATLQEAVNIIHTLERIN